MTLREVVAQLDRFDDDLTIFVGGDFEISPESMAVVILIPEDDSMPDEVHGMRCFIDVWHAREVIRGKSRHNSDVKPTVGDQVDALVDYAQSGV